MAISQKCNKPSASSILLIVAIVFYIITLFPTCYYDLYNIAGQLNLNYLSNNKFLTFERDGIYIDNAPPNETGYGAYCQYEFLIEFQYCANVTDIYNGESIQSTVNSLFSITKFIFIISIILIVIQSIISIVSFIRQSKSNHDETTGTVIISFISNYFRFSFFIINILHFIILSNRIKLENSLNSSARGATNNCDNSCVALNTGFATSLIGGVILIASCILFIKSELNKRNHSSSESYRLIFK